MPNYIYLVLDRTPPLGVQLSINSNAVYTANVLFNLDILTSDIETEGYEMKIWGDVDQDYDSRVQINEEDSEWFPYSVKYTVKSILPVGVKVLNVRLRDRVFNESIIVSRSIILNNIAPTVGLNKFILPNTNVGGFEVPGLTFGEFEDPKISEIPGRNVAVTSFVSNMPFTEFKVEVVDDISAKHDEGVLIPSDNGSINVSGSGYFPENVPVEVRVNGSDLKQASDGDSKKIIKVFAKSLSGVWCE